MSRLKVKHSNSWILTDFISPPFNASAIKYGNNSNVATEIDALKSQSGGGSGGGDNVAVDISTFFTNNTNFNNTYLNSIIGENRTNTSTYISALNTWFTTNGIGMIPYNNSPAEMISLQDIEITNNVVTAIKCYSYKLGVLRKIVYDTTDDEWVLENTSIWDVYSEIEGLEEIL